MLLKSTLLHEFWNDMKPFLGFTENSIPLGCRDLSGVLTYIFACQDMHPFEVDCDEDTAKKHAVSTLFRPLFMACDLLTELAVPCNFTIKLNEDTGCYSVKIYDEDALILSVGVKPEATEVDGGYMVYFSDTHCAPNTYDVLVEFLLGTSTDEEFARALVAIENMRHNGFIIRTNVNARRKLREMKHMLERINPSTFDLQSYSMDMDIEEFDTYRHLCTTYNNLCSLFGGL